MNTFANKLPAQRTQTTNGNLANLQDRHVSERSDRGELADSLNQSTRVQSQIQLQRMFNQSPRIVAQAKFQPIQRLINSEEDETVTQKQSADTGLPDNLKAGIEELSQMSMDNVRVHYNSDKPSQLQAHAYTQGSDIHVAPGQEQHLAHEAWHVVQQAQGRVQPTLQLNNTSINDSPYLEEEADRMGAKALQMKAARTTTQLTQIDQSYLDDEPLQLKWLDEGRQYYKWDKLQDGGIRWYVMKDSGFMFYKIEKLSTIPEELQLQMQKFAGIEHAKTREDWLEDPSFNWGPEPEWIPDDREIVNRSLTPSRPMSELQEEFQAIAKQAFSDVNVPDYVRIIVQQSGGFYNLPPPKAREQLNRLIHLHHLAKTHFSDQGVVVLARFYVQNETTGVEHPGINSWAQLAKTNPDLTDEEIYELAATHMKFGHDVPGKKDVLTKSPLVSATANIGNALLADSKYNTKVMMSLMTSRKDTGMEQSVGGKFYSQRIDRLMYGYDSEQMNILFMKQTPIANKIAFIAINAGAKHLYTPEMVNGLKEDCCTLEAENTVYAPIQDLNELLLFVMDNPLPALKISKVL